MADNLNDKGPQDRSKINLTEKWEVEYWTKLLGCTEEDLREAVEKMGNSSQVIKDYYFK